MATTKSKKLTAGVPVVDSNGAVTPVSMEELARRVGEQLGLRKASYNVSGQKWVRVAQIGTSGGLLIIANSYGNTNPQPFVIAIAGGYEPRFCTATLLTGDGRLFDKIRFVSNSHGNQYLEVYSATTQGNGNTWAIKYIDCNPPSTTSPIELYQTFTEGSVPEGYTVKEMTVAEMAVNRGGVNASFLNVYKMLGMTVASAEQKGGLRHEQDESNDRQRPSIDDAGSNGVSWNMCQSRHIVGLGCLLDECQYQMRESTTELTKVLEICNSRGFEKRLSRCPKDNMSGRYCISYSRKRHPKRLDRTDVMYRKEVVAA